MAGFVTNSQCFGLTGQACQQSWSQTLYCYAELTISWLWPPVVTTTITIHFAHQQSWIGWTQKVTNEELYRKIQLAKTLLQKVIQRKLRLFGHICRMNNSRKIKTLVFGMMDGSNKRGRPHQEWSDVIEQWCGTTLQELSHAALDGSGGQR